MKTYLVGGAVRDKLLGYPFHEHDWVVVGATPEQMLAKGYLAVGKDFPVFLHPDTKEEYALARTERKTAPGYTGFECHTSPDVSLEEDLQRRDLTINAIAEDSTGTLIDPYGGRQDINNKVLRHVSAAFTEDPLRILRVARFSARYAHLGFTLAPETLQLMQQISAGNELQALPAERIWKELERALGEKNPQQFFVTLQQAGALPVLLPELDSADNPGLALLNQAATAGQPATICFALLFFSLTNNDAQSLCRRLKCPNDYKELALLVSRWGHHCQQAFNQPDSLLNQLEALDPFRRAARFNAFLACCELYYGHSECSEQLRQALALCAPISAADLAAEGLSGREIAHTLRQRRLKALSSQLFANRVQDD